MMAAISAISIAHAGTTGTSSGSATVGTATPTISSPKLNDSTDSVNENGATISVLTEYHYNVTVGDTNTLYGLYNITFRIFDSTYSSVSAADANQTHYTFEWLNSTAAWSEVGPNAGGTDLVSGNCITPTQSGTSGTFKLAFELEGNANYTGSTSWRVNCTVYAGSTGSSTANDQTITFGLNAYYAIVVASGSSTHGWTGLVAPSDNNSLTTPASGYLTVYCTSNHYNYAVEDEGGSATLASGANTIPIGAINVDATGLTGAVNMTTSYADVPGDTGIVPTNGINTAAYIYLYISIPSGTPAGTYTYTLNLEIAAT